MRHNIEIVPCTLTHISQCADKISDQDRQEIMSGTLQDPLGIMINTWSHSPVAWAVLHDGRAIATFGAARPSLIWQGFGMPWLFTTPAVDKFPVTLLRACHPYLGRMLEEFPLLENWVSSGNQRAINWLRWLGFSFSDQPEPFGILQRPFYQFSMRG